MGYEKIHHTALLLVRLDRNVPSRYRHAVSCVCGAPLFVPASVSNTYFSPHVLTVQGFFFFPPAPGAVGCQGIAPQVDEGARQSLRHFNPKRLDCYL